MLHKQRRLEVANIHYRQELCSLVEGKRLGEGYSREVAMLDLGFDTEKRYVLKREINDKTFANISEWTFRNEICFDYTINHWFAQCHKISENGMWMIQEYARDILPTDKIPEKIPALFTDLKKDNFGFIGNQLVCRDYGFVDHSAGFKKMRKTPKYFLDSLKK